MALADKDILAYDGTDAQWENTTLATLGLYATVLKIVAPTVNDDSGDGYSVGTRWIDTVADKEYICLDATVGAAVWTETTLTEDVNASIIAYLGL